MKRLLLILVVLAGCGGEPAATTAPPAAAAPTAIPAPTATPKPLTTADLEPLLFQDGDLPKTKLNAYGEYNAANAVKNGMAEPLVSASVSARRPSDDIAPTYFARINVFNTENFSVTLQKQRDSKRAKPIEDVGEEAWIDSIESPLGTLWFVNFTRCNAMIEISVNQPLGDLEINKDTPARVAKRVDGRLQPVLCNR